MFDRTLSSAENLLALVNEDNATAFTLTDVVFVGVQSYTGERNTQVVMQNVKNDKDTVSLLYDRLTLSDIIPGPVYITRESDTEDTSAVRDAIAEQFNIVLDDNDILTEPIASDATQITLKAAAGSLAWVGTIPVVLVSGEQHTFVVNDNELLQVGDGSVLVTN